MEAVCCGVVGAATLGWHCWDCPDHTSEKTTGTTVELDCVLLARIAHAHCSGGRCGAGRGGVANTVSHTGEAACAADSGQRGGG